MPDLPAEPAGEDLPALVAALRAANARLRRVIDAKDTEISALRASHQAQLDSLRRRLIVEARAKLQRGEQP